jgi:hypothetical protein
MTYPRLGSLDRIAPLRARWRVAATWLSFLTLIANSLLPAALSIFVGLIEPSHDTLCGGWSGDTSGKAKPGLPVQHCPLCTVAAAPLPPAPGLSPPLEAAEGELLQRRAAHALATIRRGPVQARAPPAAV